MSKVVIHIGLHKTATRFLQRAVFASLDATRFRFNPPELMHALSCAIRHPSEDNRKLFLRAAEQERGRVGEHTLVVSDPDISGDMFNNHADYEDNLALMHEAFPDATVLYFVRRQSDWLHSAYRQALVKGRSAPIELFLNFRDGRFRQRLARRTDRMRTLDALGLHFLDIYRAYAEAYGAEQVYLFRQEDLRARPDDVFSVLAHSLGLEHLPCLPRHVSGNRAFSALAIRLFYPATWRMPNLERVELTDVPPPPSRFPIIRSLRTIRTAMIRHVFDRLVYVDWDLLAAHGMRERLEEYYEHENRCLKAIADVTLEEGPGKNALATANTESSQSEMGRL